MTSPPSAAADGAGGCSWEIEPVAAASAAAANAKNDSSASEPPRIANLRDLERHCCTTNSGETEYWRCLAIAAALELNPPNEHSEAMYLFGIESEAWRQALRQLEQHRYWIRQHWESEGCELMPLQEGAETVLTDEINFCFQRIFEEEEESDMTTATKSRPKTKAPKVEPPHFDPETPSARLQRKFTELPKPSDAEQTAAQNSEPERGLVIVETIDVDLAMLVRSPFQTRDDPSEVWLQEMAQSLEADGQTTPAIVRKRLPLAGYELIAGHTRRLAALKLGWRKLRCQVVECDDATAARLVYIENAKRRELTAMERARGLELLAKQYSEAGKTQQQLADDIGSSRSHVSNTLRLLKLPVKWQERLAAGKITDHHAWEILKLADFPAAIENLDEAWEAEEENASFEETQFQGWSIEETKCQIGQSAAEAGRSMRNASFKPDEETLKKLEVTEIDLGGWQGKTLVAKNVELWDQLQREASAAAEERRKKAEERRQSKSNAAPKKLDKYKLDSLWEDWFRREIAKRLQGKLTKAQRDTAWKLALLMLGDTLQDKIVEAMGLEQSYQQRPAAIQTILTKSVEEIQKIATDYFLGMLADPKSRMYFCDVAEAKVVGEAFGVSVETFAPDEAFLAGVPLELLQAAADVQNIQVEKSAKKQIELLLACWSPGFIPDELNPFPKPEPKSAKKSRKK